VSDNYTLGRALLVDLIDAQINALNTDLAADERAVWVDELEAYAINR